MSAKNYQITPAKIGEKEKNLTMSLFLDFLIKDAMQNPEKLVLYTEKMSAEIDDLLTDVTVEE